MVEIALCIAIVAFALVAIIGVLPTGMRVQKDNREDTMVNQDGTFWLEAIRGGAKGLDDLTNYVDQITIVELSGGDYLLRQYVYGSGKPMGTTNTFRTGWEIIGLLSTPKYTYDSDGDLIVNWVSAYVHSLSGSANVKPDGSRNQTIKVKAGGNQEVDVDVRDMAFKYRLSSQVLRSEPLPATGLTNFNAAGLSDAERARRLQNMVWAEQRRHFKSNCYDLRLTLAWPIYQVSGTNRVGSNRKTFRTLASASMMATNIDRRTTLYFLQPFNFIAAR
jgi:hypothetical protein